MDMDQCPCSGRSLARLLQPAVMAVLVAGPLHGYIVGRRLRELAMFRSQAPDVTGVYRLLKDMEAHGLVTAAWDLAASGPARRLYSLTASGRACLDRWIETLREYRDSVDDLLATVVSAKARPHGSKKSAAKGAARAVGPRAAGAKASSSGKTSRVTRACTGSRSRRASRGCP